MQLTGPTAGEVTGTVQPALPGVPVEVDTQNADQTWTAVATGTVAPDGTFALPVAVPAGTAYRVVVTPGQGFAPGMTVPQIATG